MTLTKEQIERFRIGLRKECDDDGTREAFDALCDLALVGLAVQPRPQVVKHMADRFLGWKLPEDFSPDGGISFQKMRNENAWPAVRPTKWEPVGTNLFTAPQAEAMVRYMLEGLPLTVPSDLVAVRWPNRRDWFRLRRSRAGVS